MFPVVSRKTTALYFERFASLKTVESSLKSMAKLCSAASFWRAILPSLIEAWRNAPVLEKTSSLLRQLPVPPAVECFALQSLRDEDCGGLDIQLARVNSATKSVSRRARSVSLGFLNIISSSVCAIYLIKNHSQILYKLAVKNQLRKATVKDGRRLTTIQQYSEM